jgi:vancomycin resistance protein VanJ
MNLPSFSSFLRRAGWRRSPLLAVAALLLGLLMLLHAYVPNRPGHLGSLLETLLPWCGLGVPLLLAGAVRRRAPAAVAALLLPTAVWSVHFGPLLGDRSAGGGDLTVVSHNVGAGNTDPVGTARALVAGGADVVALEELTVGAEPVYTRELAHAFRYHAVRGTVGLWSRLPLSEVRTVDIATDYGPLGEAKPAAARLAENRALRATVAAPRGRLAVYAVHLGSARVTPGSGFRTDTRDRNARMLGRALAAERAGRVVLLGDLNGSLDDRALGVLRTGMRSAQEAAGAGLGFSWPAGFPLVRIDHILVRGVVPVRAWVLPATGSDHLPVAAAVDW